MLPVQFFGQNVHFAISLFAALVFFAVFWLIFDAWILRREKKELLKWVGFLLISISFLIHATVLEQGVLGASILGGGSEILATLLRIFGYLGIVWGQMIDPLQPAPKTEGLVLEKKKKSAKEVFGLLPPLAALTPFLKFLLSAGALAAGLLYLRRGTIGLERHLKPVAFALFFLTIFEILSLASLLRGSANPIIYDLVAPFGPIWILEHLFLLIGIFLLGKWVWNYLVTRLQSQLFMIFTSSVLIIFLLTTASFTFLLMQNIQREALANLETAAKVLDYALGGKKAETASSAESLAHNPEIMAALAVEDHQKLATLTGKILETKKQSSLIITNEFGQVLVRAEDPDRWGDSISDDPLVKRALVGTGMTSVLPKEDVLAPLIYLKSAVPVRDEAKNIIGAAVAGVVIDDGFVDGIKNATSLDSAVYAGNVRSATTFLAPDGKHRWIGIKEENQQVKHEVLRQGKTFKGGLNVLNRPFLAVYAPLKDVDNSVVGMLFIGKPVSSIFQTAGRSVELTFLVAAVLLVISIIPAYLISKYISKQLR